MASLAGLAFVPRPLARDSDGAREPPPADNQSDGMSTEEWIVLVVLAVAAAAVIVGATYASTRHAQRKGAAQSVLRDRLNNIVGTSRWLQDQGSVEVLRPSEPEQLHQAWNGIREHAIDLESEIAVLARQVGNSRLSRVLVDLGQSVAALRGALDANVSLRVDPAALDHAELVQSSTHTVHQRRYQLDTTVAAVAMVRS